MKTRVLAGIAGALLFPLAACGSSDDGPVNKTEGIDGDFGADGPERIVAQTTVAAALTELGLGDRIVGTFGPRVDADGNPSIEAGGLEFADAEDVTGAGDYGDIDEEKVAELDPDIIVTSSYIEGDYWYMTDELYTSLGKQWDIAVISYADLSLVEQLDDMEQLAADLGADVETDEIATAHSDFAAVSETATTLGADLTAQGKTILAASAFTDAYYVSNPEVSADLNYWQSELGLPIIIPDNPDPQGYFETLTWEQADKYNGDLLLWDDRIGQSGLDLMTAQPVFATINAVQNQAYTPWSSVYPPTYATATELLNRLVAAAQAIA